MEKSTFERQYFIDWLRVIAIILVLYFHVAKIFSWDEDWHIKNEQLSYFWNAFNKFLTGFRMPLLFFISGVGTFFALRKRNALQYFKERNKRLLLPLIFGMILIIPPQEYFDKLYDVENFSHSFFSLFKEMMISNLSGGFHWAHLWFIFYLFALSIIGIPAFMFLKSSKGKRLLEKLQWISGKWGLLFLTVPTILIDLEFTYQYPQKNDFFNDWVWFSFWGTFFYAGYFLACLKNPCKKIEDNRKFYLKIALIGIVVTTFYKWNRWEPWFLDELSWGAWYKTGYIYIYKAFSIVKNWAIIFASLGYAKKYLNKNSKLLKYTNQAIYPFYILHQTVIIIIGFYILPKNEPIYAKFLYISSLSLITSLGLYEFIIRPSKLMRFIFGVKPLKKTIKENKVNNKIITEVEVKNEAASLY